MGKASALFLLLALGSPAVTNAAQSQYAVNPIRKVVTMLQNMQKKVTAEGEHEEELYHKFMCYCETNSGTLGNSISNAKSKISELTSSQKEATARKTSTEADLEKHQNSRADAKDAMAKNTGIRDKERSAFAKFSADSTANILALGKAVVAIEKGMAGSFLQTTAAKTLRSFLMEQAEVPDATRDEVLSFLSAGDGAGYAPRSGEITGILKQLKDEMSASLSSAISSEEGAISTYKGLMAAKTKEVATLNAQIESELARMGELGVSLAAMTNELEDTREGLAQDGDFLAELSGGCATKKQEWEVVKATRQQELLAIAETIKVLNDDDALDLFKKTLPTPAASFVEIKVNAAAMRARAITLLRRAQGRPELDLIALAINGKKIGFEKVVAMIDSMVANLKVEQRDDDNKKEYCDSQFDLSDDKKKGLENSITDSESAIEEMRGAIATLKEEIAALTAGIQALDKSVAEATAQRKAEHDDYNELIANNAAAKELMLWAKNRLNKFYNPKLYKAAPKRVLSEEERITLNMGGTLAPTSASGIADTGISVALLQTSAHSAGVAAPPPPPATFGAYSKKPEGTGVIAMIDLLVADLDKETTEATTEENDAQSDYEKAMSGAAKKRAQDSKSLTDKSAERAKLEESLGEELDQKDGLKKDLGATLKYIHSLHAECDWLLKYFEVRKQARTGEIESLGQAKAVLNGADFALLQTRHSLRQQHALSPQ